MRIILFTGKGGVGKTTVSAATALHCAELGYRTIVLSTDAAHSLSDSFDIILGDEPKQIAANLWAQETNINKTIEHYWGTIRKWMTALLAWRGMNEIVADEMAILPGMEELANLLYIVNYYESGDYDAVLVDCAPTGDTLRLLGFPEVLRWWMGRMFPIGRTAATMLRPFVKPMLGMPLPNAEVFDSIEDLYQELLRMHSLLTDPEKSSVRLVLNPEKMVINEAQRTFAYLNLYGYPVDGIICNRLLPDELEHSFFNSWKESQNKYYQLVEQSFSPIPILKAPLLEQEVVGEERLRTLAQALYQEQDPLKFFFKGKTQQIEKEDTYYVLSLILPFTTKEQVSLMRHSDELIVQVGSFRRQLFLPHFLAELSVKEAKFEDEKLKIKFAEGDIKK